MRGMPFACVLRAGNHPLPISATAKSGWTVADPSYRSWRSQPYRNPFAQRHHFQLRRRARAVRSASTLQLKHLRHLRWQVSCAPRVRRRRWCRCSGNECPRHQRQSLAQRVCVASASQCIAGLLWCRCSEAPTAAPQQVQQAAQDARKEAQVPGRVVGPPSQRSAITVQTVPDSCKQKPTNWSSSTAISAWPLRL